MFAIAMFAASFLMFNGANVVHSSDDAAVEFRHAIEDLALASDDDEDYFYRTTLPWLIDIAQVDCADSTCMHNLHHLELALDQRDATALRCDAHLNNTHIWGSCTGENFAEIWFVKMACGYLGGAWDGEDTCSWDNQG